MTKLKIVVANPPWPGEGYGTRSNIRWPHRRGDKVLTFPIYLAYAVANLKKAGFDTLGIDAVDKEWGIPQFVKEVKKLGPDVILMEVSTPTFMFDQETAFLLKKDLPKAKIFLCGPHVAYFHKDIVDDYRFIDGCIRYEFDVIIKDICKAISKNENLDHIQGLTFRDGSDTKINPDRPFIQDLDGLPYPDREDFRIGHYRQAFFEGKNTALMISSRGCPYRCTFCLWPQSFTGNKFRARNPNNVVDEIEYMIKKYKVDEIYFDDDTIDIDKKRLKEICEGIISRKISITWQCMARVNAIDLELLRLMKKSGCREIFFGFESGSQRILNISGKGIKKEQIINAVKLTRKAGIRATGSFVIGLPGETKNTIDETIRFAKKLHADYVQFTLASAFPGTALYEKVKSEGHLAINSWQDFDGCSGATIATESLSKEDLDGTIRKMYLRYYLSLPVIWQNLSNIRSKKDFLRIIQGFRSFLSRIVFYKKK